jgi:arylsulfatase A-like enzyme
VLITVDTLRADHTGIYGYARPTTPALDRLSQDGIVFELAIVQAPWTLPSMASLHTSLYPSEHRAVTASAAIAESETTIAEALKRVGYHTIAVVSHTFVARDRGFGQGFDRFDESLISCRTDIKSSTALTTRALEILADDSQEPFLLWIHYFDPHYDYVRHRRFGFADGYPEELSDEISILDLRRRAKVEAERNPQGAAAALDYARAVYDEEIRFTDLALGRLVRGIDKMDLERPTQYVITADHGEAFMDHGDVGHDRDVYQELIHVPLVFFGDVDPDLRGTRVAGPVEVRSIAKTLARRAGSAGDEFGGQDLMERARGIIAATPALSEGSFAWGSHDREVAIVGRRWKFIESWQNGEKELYDLADDPAEQVNRYAGRHGAAIPKPLSARMAEHARRLKRARPPARRLELSAERKAQLRDLGYLAPDTETTDRDN